MQNKEFKVLKFKRAVKKKPPSITQQILDRLDKLEKADVFLRTRLHILETRGQAE